ncbi:hypothetical protein LZB38_07880, partial [Campylobacter jejuni]|nr:hypothetical protein [Campylobacter jejuni]
MKLWNNSRIIGSFCFVFERTNSPNKKKRYSGGLFCYTLNYPLSKHDLKDLKERCNEQSWEQGLHVPEKGKTFAGEVREETVAWSKDTYQLLKQA